jgi:hypothetical protein
MNGHVNQVGLYSFSQCEFCDFIHCIAFICSMIHSSLSLEEGCKIKMGINILGTKSEEVIKSWRKLRNEEVHNLCYTAVVVTV